MTPLALPPWPPSWDANGEDAAASCWRCRLLALQNVPRRLLSADATVAQLAVGG